MNCTPPSDELFAVGTTQVECTVTDSLNRTASCSFAAIVSAPPRLRLTRFMAFGDSITEGQLVVPGTDDGELIARPEVSYPTVLAQLLSARYTDQSMAVFNRGLGGERAERALSRFLTQFRSDAPTAVVLMEGYNDIIAGESGLGIIAGAAGVRELAANGRSLGARIFICTLAPSRPGRKQIPMSALREINDRLREVARVEGAYLIDVFAALLPDVNTMVSGDGLHLTVAGNRRVAETVYSALREDLEIK